MIDEKRAAALRERRLSVFIKEGLPKDEAVFLSDRMGKRDATPYDDRRVCFECENYDPLMRKCNKQKALPLRFILQRCKMFELKKVKK